MRRLINGFAVARYLPLYLVFALLKHIVSLKRLARWAWRRPMGRRDPSKERRAIANIYRLSELAGVRDEDCLQRSLLLYSTLSRLGADPKLVVGLGRSKDKVAGHAWVMVDTRAVNETGDHLREFPAVLAFGMEGAPVDLGTLEEELRGREASS